MKDIIKRVLYLVITNMIRIIKKVSKQPITGTNACDVPDTTQRNHTRDELLGMFDFSKVPEVKTGEGTGPNLLIVDDIPETMYLMKSTSNELRRRHTHDFFTDFAVTPILMIGCGFTTYKYVMTPGVKIDYALLDISIATRASVQKIDILELDGIDIADIILKKNPEAKVRFFTAHTLGRDDKRMDGYYKKCKALLGTDLLDMTIFKNSDRFDSLNTFLYGAEEVTDNER